MASEAAGRPESIALPPPSAGSDLGATAREYLLAVREAAGAWHHAGGGGTDVVDYFTASIDSLICFLAASASRTWRQRYVQGDEEIAVLAQGGYGRAETQGAQARRRRPTRTVNQRHHASKCDYMDLLALQKRDRRELRQR